MTYLCAAQEMGGKIALCQGSGAIQHHRTRALALGSQGAGAVSQATTSHLHSSTHTIPYGPREARHHSQLKPVLTKGKLELDRLPCQPSKQAKAHPDLLHVSRMWL